MKFEIRDAGLMGALGLAVVGGDLVPGQISSTLSYASEAGGMSTLTVTFQVGSDLLPLRIGLAQAHQPQDLQKCASLFAALSAENRARFITMYAETLDADRALRTNREAIDRCAREVARAMHRREEAWIHGADRRDPYLEGREEASKDLLAVLRGVTPA